MKKGDMLKVLEKHKMLTLALGKKITQEEALEGARSFPFPHQEANQKT